MKQKKIKNADRISKSEAARRLKISPAMVTRYLEPRYDMPHNADGSLSWSAVQKWHKGRIVPELSRNWFTRRPAIASPMQTEIQTAEDLANALLEPKALLEFARVLVKDLGLTPKAALFATELHSKVVFNGVGDEEFMGAHCDPSVEQWSTVLGTVNVQAFQKKYDSLEPGGK